MSITDERLGQRAWMRELEKRMYETMAKVEGFYTSPEGRRYCNERSDLMDYMADLNIHRIYLSNRPYKVLNVGVGTGAECKPAMQLLADKLPGTSTYVATNVVTPPDFEITSNFISTHYPELDVQYFDDYYLEDQKPQGDVAFFFSSRVLEWSPNPLLWLQNAYDSLAPGGIGIIHTRVIPKSENVVQLAKNVGIPWVQRIPEYYTIPPISEVCRMLFYKPTGNIIEFPGWTDNHRFETHFNASRYT